VPNIASCKGKYPCPPVRRLDYPTLPTGGDRASRRWLPWISGRPSTAGGTSPPTYEIQLANRALAQSEAVMEGIGMAFGHQDVLSITVNR
jgi:hypothetical protein